MKPIIVFAPGAWHPANTFDSLAALLATDGYESQTIAFPAIHRTIKIKEPSLALEIAAARGVIEPLVEAGREVVLVMHSWGGVPGNSALGGLTVRERKALGKAGGVRHLVFMAAFVARIGQSVSDLSGPLPWLTIDGNAGTSFPKDPGYRFYHDVAEDEAQKWVNALVPHAAATTMAPATAAACISTPSTYILCAQDNAIPLALQKKMVARAREDGSNMESVLLNTSHSPWMVEPKAVVDVLKSAAQSQVAAVL